MVILETALPEIKLLEPVRHGDSRGFFAETYNKRSLSESGIEIEFVQDNHSLSASAGTIRGLHYQLPPYAQDKLLQVMHGSVLDVAVDIRRDSPTFGQHVCAVISADRGNQILVPQGFAHGFCTLEPDTEVTYKVSNYYAPEHDRGIAWDDPALGIRWPVQPGQAVVSERDQRHPRLQDASDLF